MALMWTHGTFGRVRLLTLSRDSKPSSVCPIHGNSATRRCKFLLYVVREAPFMLMPERELLLPFLAMKLREIGCRAIMYFREALIAAFFN